ncbi:MAG: hypothetical protein V4447_08020 [Pseudomonadota bacterium]
MNLNFKLQLIKTLVLTEARLRLRRLSTLVVLLAVIAISWAMIPDPNSDMTMMAIEEARVLYTSSLLSFGTASLASMLFGIAGFYLVRGRIAEDLRSGNGSVIGATQVGNGIFLFSRWLGGVLYLLTLVAGLLGTTLVCHLLRGDGPIQLLVYLQTYSLLLLPTVFFVVSCAILFDSVAGLMGKAGDLIYFMVWMAQMALMAIMDESIKIGLNPLLLLDFMGLATGMINLKMVLLTDHLSLGVSTFDAKLPTITLANALWSMQIIWWRCATAVIALLPLLPAIFFFHRYSPDRVKLSSTRKRRSPLDIINAWSRPLAKLVQPLFRLSASVPGLAGRIMADIALSLVTSPSAILVLVVVLLASMFSSVHNLSGVLIAAVVFWGVMISDISTRDFQANTEELTGAVPGGIVQRYLRQFTSAAVLGSMFMGVIALRWSFVEPVRAAALISGVLSLSALATLFGRCSGTARTFLALFLFGVYVALNVTKEAVVDVVGFNGVANLGSIQIQLAIAVISLAAGYLYNRQRAH